MTMIAYAFLQHRRIAKAGGKKESTGHHLSPACRPCATPSSLSFFGHQIRDAHTAEDRSAKSNGVNKSAKVVLAHRLFRQRREGILKYDLDGMGAAAASRRAAERRVDVADPRTRYSGCDRASHLTVAKDVTAADDHGALLAGESFSVGAMKPTAAVSKPSAASAGKPNTETVFWNRLNGRGLTSF
jgi:hypothetical protein